MMEISISDSKVDLGQQAAIKGASLIQTTIQEKGSARIILATGASQFELLSALLKQPIDWPKVTVFHLDEYIGLPASHPASFRKYLKERFADKVRLRQFNYVNGENDPVHECARVKQLINRAPIDVAFIGIGENGHLAFNDPPADFDTEEPYIQVQLDEACRNQQFREGWFSTLEQVPKEAISMSIQQILKAKNIICSVPDQRKARAVKNSLHEPISPMNPASILRQHPATWLFLDKASAALL
jgi:glucosamine-6-phosphate deaminase